jgi:type IV pilus assembly protein PilV
MKRRMQSPRSQQGVMLIEALVAILIFTLGIIALMGLQANSIVQVSQAKYRTDASYLANQIVGKMWVDQSNMSLYTSPSYPGRTDWDALVAATLPAGTATIGVAPVPPSIVPSLVTVTIQWKQPEDVVTRRYVAVANLNP